MPQIMCNLIIYYAKYILKMMWFYTSLLRASRDSKVLVTDTGEAFNTGEEILSCFYRRAREGTGNS